MSEEKVGFKFDFGLKGEKEVKHGIEEIFRLIGSAPNMVAAASGVGKAMSGLFEMGKLSAPITAAVGALGLGATALGIFGMKAEEAGENMRQARFDIERLARIPSVALSDSDLSSNQSALVEEYKRLGLEAGSTFTLSFMDRLKNLMEGAKAVAVDFDTSIFNLISPYGLKLPSYESMSPAATKAQQQLTSDQDQMVKRIQSESFFKNWKSGVDVWAGYQQAQVLGGKYVTPEMWKGWKPKFADVEINGQKFGNPKIYNIPHGVMPESYAGKMRLREISREADSSLLKNIIPRLEFESNRLQAVKLSPAPFIRGTDTPDNAKRAADIADAQGKILALQKEQVEVTKAKLDLDIQDRQAMREASAGLNGGPMRALGLGGFVTNAYGIRGMGDAALKTPGHGVHPLFGHGRIQHDLFGISGPAGIGSFHPGTMESVNVLKNIDSNISRLGIPTLKN